MKLTMIGSGYVGLVSGACFADFGHDVTCVDTDEDKIAKLNGGELPIYEPGLDELVRNNVAVGRLSFTTDVGSAVRGADAVFIAVGTPSRRGDGHADLQYVYAAVEDVARHLTGYTLIVTKSTVPVGTGDEVDRIVREVAPNADVSVASNPEFLREGAAIADFKVPDRVVIGVEDNRATETLRALYRPICPEVAPLFVMRRRSAELTKYAANAFLATKISFINEVADLCEKVGADISEVSHGMGSDRRIGPQFLNPGPGYGGSCFPKDTLAYLRTSKDYDAPQRIVESVVLANSDRKRAMGRRVVEAMGGNVRGKTVAVLGLTFKANTDDMRDSPALDVIQAIQDSGGRVQAFDPKGMDQAAGMMTDVTFCAGPWAAMDGCDAVVIATEWDEFRALDLDRVRSKLLSDVFVDLRNLYDPGTVEAAGLTYHGIGR